MSKGFADSAQGVVADGFIELTQAKLIADLQAARVEAGISSEDAAKRLGIPREVFDDVEAGRINLNMTEIREYAWVVGVVIEYSVNPLPKSIKSQLAKNLLRGDRGDKAFNSADNEKDSEI